jgi:K+-transporting ATPase KdpF subunit
MSVMNWIGLALALGLAVYLVAALLLPETFE